MSSTIADHVSAVLRKLGRTGPTYRIEGVSLATIVIQELDAAIHAVPPPASPGRRQDAMRAAAP